MSDEIAAKILKRMESGELEVPKFKEGEIPAVRITDNLEVGVPDTWMWLGDDSDYGMTWDMAPVAIWTLDEFEQILADRDEVQARRIRPLTEPVPGWEPPPKQSYWKYNALDFLRNVGIGILSVVFVLTASLVFLGLLALVVRFFVG